MSEGNSFEPLYKSQIYKIIAQKDNLIRILDEENKKMKKELNTFKLLKQQIATYINENVDFRIENNKLKKEIRELKEILENL